MTSGILNVKKPAGTSSFAVVRTLRRLPGVLKAGHGGTLDPAADGVLPILINTYAGVQNTDPDLLEAARSFGARRGQLFRHIMLPGALPYIVTGLRLGAGMAMVGTVIAELQTALAGLGYLMAQFGSD